MIDKCFYKNVGPFTLSEIALKLNLDFSGDPNFKIKDIATLDLASSNEISFFHKKKYIDQLIKSKAGVVIIKKEEGKKINKTNLLFSDDPYLSMAQVASTFYPDCEYPNFSYPNSKKKNLFLIISLYIKILKLVIIVLLDHLLKLDQVLKLALIVLLAIM